MLLHAHLCVHVSLCVCVPRRASSCVRTLSIFSPPLPPNPPIPPPSSEPDWDFVVRKMEKQIRAGEAASALLPPGCRRNQHNPSPLPPLQVQLDDLTPLPPPPREHLFQSFAGRAWPATLRPTPLHVPACKLTGRGRISDSLPAGIRQGLVMLADLDAGLMRETYLL